MNRLRVTACSAMLALTALTGRAQVVWYSSGWADDSDSYLGVYLKDITADSVAELNLPTERGAICAEVIPDTPAEEAGLQADDVVVAWNGAQVESARQLQRLVSETPVDREVTLDVIRSGETLSLRATVGRRTLPGIGGSARPDSHRGQIPFGSWHPPIDNPDAFPGMFQQMKPRLGIMMQPLTEQLAGFFGLGDNEGGVLVASVMDDSAAAAAGMQAGDVITEIDGEAVGTPAEVQDRILRADGLVDVAVVRAKAVVHVEVNLVDDGDPAATDSGGDGDESLHDEITFPRGSM